MASFRRKRHLLPVTWQINRQTATYYPEKEGKFGQYQKNRMWGSRLEQPRTGYSLSVLVSKRFYLEGICFFDAMSGFTCLVEKRAARN